MKLHLIMVMALCAHVFAYSNLLPSNPTTDDLHDFAKYLVAAGPVYTNSSTTPFPMNAATMQSIANLSSDQIGTMVNYVTKHNQLTGLLVALEYPLTLSTISEKQKVKTAQVLIQADDQALRNIQSNIPTLFSSLEAVANNTLAAKQYYSLLPSSSQTLLTTHITTLQKLANMLTQSPLYLDSRVGQDILQDLPQATNSTTASLSNSAPQPMTASKESSIAAPKETSSSPISFPR